MGKAQNSRTGKPMAKRLMEQYELAESRKDSDLEKVRLRNISLRTALKKLERQLRAREQLAEGLHMIDFEQLKIENQTLNEKIEERNEELAKLKRKKRSHVECCVSTRTGTLSSSSTVFTRLAFRILFLNLLVHFKEEWFPPLRWLW